MYTLYVDVYDVHSKHLVFCHNKKAFSKLCRLDYTPWSCYRTMKLLGIFIF